jgi:hypothetical protein
MVVEPLNLVAARGIPVQQRLKGDDLYGAAGPVMPAFPTGKTPDS